MKQASAISWWATNNLLLAKHTHALVIILKLMCMIHSNIIRYCQCYEKTPLKIASNQDKIYILFIVSSARRRSFKIYNAAKRNAAAPSVATKGVNIKAFRNANHWLKLSSSPCRRKSLIAPMIYGLDASPYYNNTYRKKNFLKIF